MSDILKIAKFDAGVQTPSGRQQFSATDTAGELVVNREYRESFDKFKSGCTCGDSYIWRVLSAVADETGLVLYDNVKNYIDYVTNVDLCKVQSLRSMVKMYGLEYRVFDRLDLLPVEILDLINIFSINKKHLLYGDKLLADYKNALSAEGVILEYEGGNLSDTQTSAILQSRVLDCDCLTGGKYRQFMADQFFAVLSGVLSMPYEEDGEPIYSMDGDSGIYDDLCRRREKYTRQYEENTVEYNRRQYKILNGVSLLFDECAALDRIEAGLELESDYQGFELKLIQMERELRQRPYSANKTSRYAFYKKQRVLEYANFVTDKYFSDHKCSDLSAYDLDSRYFQVLFKYTEDSGDPGSKYEESGESVIYKDENGALQIRFDMLSGVAESLADTALYISRIREKIKLQARKNYMKGTYDLMLYVINEFLVDYSRLNPMFRDSTRLSGASATVSQLLAPIYADLSAHDVRNLTAIEYFDETEYYNISADTDAAGHPQRYSSSGVNDRFWHYPAGEYLMDHDGIDRDFDAESIKSFYMDTLGIRDNYISDDNALCAFLDAVFSLGAVDSFVHGVNADTDGNISAHELFGAQITKYGSYSDDLYEGYLAVRRAWQVFTSYLSGNEYDYPVSDCVSAQVLSAADYIRQLILDRELSAVSAVHDAYIDRADQISAMADLGIELYSNLISGEYAFYFKKQSSYKYCFDDRGIYKHKWYVGSRDVGLEYWYDMIQTVDEYASGSDAGGDYITNWPIRDTVDYFYSEFIKLSGWYVDMTTSVAVPGIGIDIKHDWSKEYGFVDISAVSLEDELKHGYDFMSNLIAERKQYLLDQSAGESIIENDDKIQTYRKYIRAVIQLSSLYLPIKYEYDSISKDQKQRAYLSEFTPDNEMTLVAISRLSAYSIEKDRANKEAILDTISQMRQRHDEALSVYQDVAEHLAQEYMLPQAFQPYVGYIEEMVSMMYEALRTDVDEKTWYAHSIAEGEYKDKIAPTASELIARLAQYAGSVYKLPDAVSRRLRELYYFDEPSYIRQKEMFLTYGGRSFCYYPYYNIKNVVHSSYQVHPFLWNFIRRESASNVVRKTFYSVKAEELERRAIAQNWQKFFGDYGESKYLDLSKPKYPDYSGYQSRYENSSHIADNTQFVSEVVDYDGAFYPPAVEWLRENGIDKAIASISDAQYNKKISETLRNAIPGLSSLEWETAVRPELIRRTRPYCASAQVAALTSYVYGSSSCYDSGKRALSDITPYDVYTAAAAALSGESTFYGRFYRQLRLDQYNQQKNRDYIVNQLSCYWGHKPVPGGGPSISAITNPATLDKAFDIYRYGIDSYGNMYCLYKQYDSGVFGDAVAQGGLSYKYKRSTPGSLWIRLKNHPLAFPAFSGRYPNVYLEQDSKRHVAFRNLLNLYSWSAEEGEVSLSGDEIYTKLSADGAASAASCIYDFEFTKNRNDITFVTQMRSHGLSCDSRYVQCYENPWLVHCRPEQEIFQSENGVGRTVLKLYSPAGETDYYQSGDDYKAYSRLSSESQLSGEGVELYQYIGSYLKGDSSIYHAYAMQHVYIENSGSSSKYMTSADSAGRVTREIIDRIKIFPSINGKYNEPILGKLAEDGSLSIAGSDVCLAYDEENNILNFAAQTVLAPSAAVSADAGLIGLSSNAAGATIGDPASGEMNSHDIFDTNVTFFRKQVVSRRLKDVRGSGSAAYEFNTNADISYFPVYPGFAGAKKLYMRPQYEHYSVELLGMSKDISRQISYINPQPDPYLDAADISSNFANARVYQDYAKYVDETVKTVDNKLIGVNSDASVEDWSINDQQVVCRDGSMIWQIGIDRLYKNFDPARAMKMKVLLFSRKCYGRNPYVFIDMSALTSGWVDLNYDAVGDNPDEYSVISAADYVFGYGNRVLAQPTLDGIEMTAVGDSNHIYNIKSVQARLSVDESGDESVPDMTLEFKFQLDDESMSAYTYVPAGQLQAVFLDVRNLDIFNYFHYLDAYGVLRFLDFFKSQEYINRFLVKRGDGYTIYYRGHEFTEEELMHKLRSYYEYRAQLVPLSSVDLSQYDSLSDVYILQGDARLQFKVDEEFRYELEHPSYFYPTVNAKFPATPAQYALQMTSVKNNAAVDLLAGLFGQDNLFLLDMQDPEATLADIGRVDIPVLLDDQECAFAYEEYMDYAEGELSSRRNCDLYDLSDPRVLQFVQFEADAEESGGVPARQAFEIPDESLSAVSIDTALDRISEYMANEYKVGGVCPLATEAGRSQYALEYIGFTLDGGSLSREQVEELSRIYVNYRKCEDSGGKRIQLYFNYMNYLNSPYLCVRDGRTYIDLVDNTYLSLKPDENGILDIVTQFRYYKGGTLCGYRNVRLASYQIYNISDDKPKFLIKNIYRMNRDDGSNKTVQPLAALYVCDTELDARQPGGENDQMEFDLAFEIETSAPLKQIQFYVDYPTDFMEFTSESGSGWRLDSSIPGYAKLTVDPSTRFMAVPAKTVHTKKQLGEIGDQSVVVYIDEPVVVGQNDMIARAETKSGKITVRAGQATGGL